MMEKSRSVKKTLTIPQWLDEMAASANLNFSHVLQEGLKKELHIGQ
jgi:post-segregation antitoxin (ccd killing protein)